MENKKSESSIQVSENFNRDNGTLRDEDLIDVGECSIPKRFVADAFWRAAADLIEECLRTQDSERVQFLKSTAYSYFKYHYLILGLGDEEASVQSQQFINILLGRK